MELNGTYFLTLKKIYLLAQAVQTDIQIFQPDVLIILARGGVGPLWALQTLWEETKSISTSQHVVPPVVITNLGREKLLRYEYHRVKIGMNHMPEFEPFEFSGDGERGYFLAWLNQQMDWCAELRHQVETALGSKRQPARILVLDDTVNKRYTTLITLGLLLAEFPQAETRMLAGSLPDWRQDLSAPWLAERLVLPPDPKDRGLQDCVYNLAPGISDVDRSSLQWEPITASSPTMREYGKYLSVETWLELPAWLQAQVRAYVKQSVHQGQPAGAADIDHKEEMILRPALTPVELSYRARWLSASLPPEEAKGILGLSIEDAKALLKSLANRS